MSFLHNNVVTMGDKVPVHVNLPPNFDIIFEVLPECIDFDETMQNLTYRASNVDFNTGSVQRFLVKPQAVMAGELAIRTFTRDHYNKLLDMTFLTEGRYLSFWMSDMSAAYTPLCYVGPRFPELESVDTLFNIDPDTGEKRRWFYGLNWGQAEIPPDVFRMLAVYTHGYRRCYWTYVTSVTADMDPRFVRVNIAHDLPEIPINDITLITEYTYARRTSDEAPFGYITNELVEAPFTFEEDAMHAYNPWTTVPPIYPVYTTTP